MSRVADSRAGGLDATTSAVALHSLPEAALISQTSDGRIVEVNERWEAMTGYSRRRAVGRTIHELRLFARGDARAVVRPVRTGRRVRRRELALRTRRGAMTRTTVSVEPIVVAGEQCVLLRMHDVAHRQPAEDALPTQRRQLAHLGRVAILGQLAGALAHELSQPLTAILANARAAQLILAHPGANLPEVAGILDDIVAGITRSHAIVDRIRAMIRGDDPRPEVVVLNDVVADVLVLMQSDLAQRGVAVETRLDRPGPNVRVDRIQLQQVLLNLAVNACDAIAQAGVQDRRITIRTWCSRKAACLAVADTGTGIQTSPVDAIFDPFVTSKPQGLGLGLAISRSIVRANGGRLWAVNNAGGGATLHLSLPVWAGRVR